MSKEATNTGGSKEEFNRTYYKYNPAPQQGPPTEVLGTVLKPSGS